MCVCGKINKNVVKFIRVIKLIFFSNSQSDGYQNVISHQKQFVN